MRNILRNIFVASFALFFAWVATGINVYHYCCDACASYGGGNVFLLTSCEEVHAHHHCTEQGHCHKCGKVQRHVNDDFDLCSHLTSESDHCDAHHFSIDNQDFTNIHIGLQIPVCIINNVKYDYTFENVHICKSFFITKDSPPEYTGRDRLALFSSLLI